MLCPCNTLIPSLGHCYWSLSFLKAGLFNVQSPRPHICRKLTCFLSPECLLECNLMYVCFSLIGKISLSKLDCIELQKQLMLLLFSLKCKERDSGWLSWQQQPCNYSLLLEAGKTKHVERTVLTTYTMILYFFLNHQIFEILDDSADTSILKMKKKKRKKRIKEGKEVNF